MDSSRRLTIKALFFPAAGDAPRLVDVPCELRPDEDHPCIMQHTPDWETWFGNIRPYPITIQRHGKDGPLLGHTLTVVYNENFFNDGSPRNKCIQKLTNGVGHPWCGNYLAFRQRPPVDRTCQFEDATMGDVPPLVAYFTECTGASLSKPICSVSWCLLECGMLAQWRNRP